MDEKERCSIEERIRGNCAENRRHIDASRFQDKGQTSRSVQVTSHNFDKMMDQRGLTPEQTKQLKESFQPGTIEARHGKKGEAFVVTSGEKNASGIFVSKESLGKTPEERINKGALPPSNNAHYETRVVLDRNQTLLSGKIAAQPDFVEKDPSHQSLMVVECRLLQMEAIKVVRSGRKIQNIRFLSGHRKTTRRQLHNVHR